MKKYFSLIINNYLEIFIVFFSLTFSFWLMFSTFSYNNGSILISTKAWSDFASHIPLIRSFSLGSNFPPEYPIFPGEPIRYHFLFYALVGLIEKLGLRIDFALNLPSAFSFAGLLIIIFFLAKNLFKSKFVGLLSVVFFLFNGSLSFLEFFKIHPLSKNLINDIFNNSIFPSFGPYDGKIVSAFWNLNIYTNQRHLALPLAFLFLLVFFIVKNEETKKNAPLFLIIIFGLIIGLLPLSHSSIFIMVFAVFGILFFLLKNQRKTIFLMLSIGALISLPRIIFLKQTMSYSPHFQLGYLISGNFNLSSFSNYWFMNLGLSFVLIPIGFILASKFQRKIFLAFSSLFLIANLFQLSPEIAGNHKFLNAFLIIGNMFSALVLLKLWNFHVLAKIAIPLLIFLMTFSGIIDFFPIKNDRYLAINDYMTNQSVKWTIENTPRNSIFLNSSYLYTPASLAGRKIFFGWPYFAWSLGYNTDKRGKIMEKIWQLTDKKESCRLLKENSLDYLEINKNSEYKISDLYNSNNFYLSFSNLEKTYFIYDVKKSCN